MLLILGMQNSWAQVSFNKRVLGSIGSTPKAGDFLNSASLDNVDMTTGTLKVGIPLYEIKVNDISVPIMLNYTALGLKVGQDAGIVGMGWEFSSGGKVFTNVIGKADDAYPGGIISNSIPDNFNFNVYGEKEKLQDIIDGKLDNGWDVYNYVLPNGGGSFTQNGLTFPYDPLVRIDGPNRIQTTDGLIYNFSIGDRKKISKVNFYQKTGIGELGYVSGGVTDLNPVYSPDYDVDQIVSTRFRDTVFFKYNSYNSGNSSDMLRLSAKMRLTSSESMNLYRNVRTVSQTNGGISPSLDDRYYDLTEPSLSQTRTEYVQHSTPKSIHFTGGFITFDYYNDAQGRDAMQNMRIFKISGADTSMVQRYHFKYRLDISKAYYLEFIDIYNSVNAFQGAWEFSYNGQLPIPPSEDSKARDRWGFYNGATTNKTLLENPYENMALNHHMHHPFRGSSGINDIFLNYTRPENQEYYGLHNIYNGSYHINFANRNYSFNHASLGILTRVQTPTGGSYYYKYEPHRFTYHPVIGQSHQTAITSGGGIRIKSIEKRMGHTSLHYGLSDKVVVKRYDYGSARYDGYRSDLTTAGYGVVTIPGNVLKTRSAYYNAFNTLPTFIANITLLSHPVNDMVQYGGSYGVYSSVTESLTGELDSTNTVGKTIYYSELPSSRDSEFTYGSVWQIDEINLPFMSYNPGVRKAEVVGVEGIRKYAAKGSGEFQLLEETLYKFKEFKAPQDKKLMSFFGTITGQMHGPIPAPPGAEIVDLPYPMTGSSAFVYNYLASTHSVDPKMDYLTKTSLLPEGTTLDFEGKYYYLLLNLNEYSNCFKKEQDIVTIHADGGGLVHDQLRTHYFYENPQHLLPTKIGKLSSRGDSTFTRIRYPQDLSSSSFVGEMISTGIGLDQPIEEMFTYKTGRDRYSEWMQHYTLNTFKFDNGGLLPHKIFKNSYPLYWTAIADIDHPTDVIELQMNPKLKVQVSYDQYNKGNVTQYKELASADNAVLWGYNDQYPIAKASNARITDIAYSSFENKDKGNWSYTGTLLADESSPSGRKVYNLSSGAISKAIPEPKDKYVVSYWYKTGSTVTISGGTVGAEVVKHSKGDWVYAEREISGAIGTVNISGSGRLDELRLYPADAQMSSYVYDPRLGVTCVFDVNGKAQYYEYDESQRLVRVRDMNGNSVKAYKYIIGSANQDDEL